MNNHPPTWTHRTYFFLLRLYPRSLRDRFGAEMFQLFSDDWRMRKHDGQRAVPVRMWLRAFRDVVVNGLVSRFGGGGGRSPIGNRFGRERRRWSLEAVSRDVRISVRSLRRSPVFSAVVVGTFALGIGVNAAIFGVVDGVLFRPLPFDQPNELVRVWSVDPELGDRFLRSTFAEVTGVAEGARSLSGVAAYSMVPGRVLDAYSTPETVILARLTGDLPGILGARPVIGRGFRPDDFQSDGRVALISHGLWQRRYGGAEDVVGRSISLRDEDLVVIGVLPEIFEYPMAAEAWRPFPRDAYQDDDRELEIIGRLHADVDATQATAEVRTIMTALRADGADPEEVKSAWVQPLHGMVTRTARTPLLVLLASVGVVLLVCCMNVANLMLARVTNRQSELAIRTALGASRPRLLQLLITEGVLLAGLGCGFGLVLGQWLLQVIVQSAPPDTPRLSEVSLDLRVASIMFGVSLVVGVLSSLFPAVRYTVRDLARATKQSGRGGTDAIGSTRTQQSLIVAEVGLSTVLVFAAALFVGTFLNLMNHDRGFVTERLLAVPVSIAEDHGSDQSVRTFYLETADAVRRLPGVTGVALSFRSPLQPLSFRVPLSLQPGGPDRDDDPVPYLRSVSTEYFATVGIPVRDGRVFDDRDGSDAPPVGVVNQAFVREHFAGQSPVGRRLYDGTASLEIVGVVGDLQPTPDAIVSPVLYRPFLQLVIPFNYLMVKTRDDPLDLVPSIRQVIWSIDPTVALDDITTIDAAVAESVAAPRFIMLLIGGFAALALALAGVGVYGVMSCTVTRRTRELGLRQALGASRHTVLRRILYEGVRLTGLGVLIGVPVALMTGRLMRGMLYEMEGASPFLLLAVAGTLAVVSLCACVLPAIRATKVEPLLALRGE